MIMKRFCIAAAMLLLCGITGVQAQVMKAADLEKYAKERYGEKWPSSMASWGMRMTTGDESI